MNNIIKEFMNLKEEDIEFFKTEATTEEILVFLSLKIKSQPCPFCGINTDKIKDTYLRKINHGLLIGRKCIIHFNQKRYRCVVCKKTWNEFNPLVPNSRKNL